MDTNVNLEEDTQHGRFLTFELGSEIFGLEIQFVTEIVVMQPITTIPEVPAYVRGIINLRGKIIPVIDMRLKFSKESKEYDDRTCIIVVEIKDLSVGLIVDAVAEVVVIEDENVVPPPSYSTGVRNRYLKGVGKVGSEVKLLLDTEQLFKADEYEALEKLN